jgi:hypothetical protein
MRIEVPVFFPTLRLLQLLRDPPSWNAIGWTPPSFSISPELRKRVGHRYAYAVRPPEQAASTSVRENWRRREAPSAQLDLGSSLMMPDRSGRCP